MLVAAVWLIALAVTGGVRGQDVVGCGGFVRSKFPVDFTRVQVMLVTTSGILKYKTDCAPNNGYFLLPLYDKGEFVLKVDPPEGWIFEPAEVHLSVDGKTDRCSKGEDIDFNLLGFTIFGQVRVISLGRAEGARGVTVTLQGPGDDKQEVLTEEGGRYSFEGVLPGDYHVIGSHATWSVSKDPVTGVVEDDSIHATGITILGFDVQGYVYSQGEAVPDVHVLLFAKEDVKVDCDAASVPEGQWERKPSCAVTSDGNGEFVLPSLPPGEYRLVPHYRRGQIVFEVQPPEIVFSVSNDSVVVQPSFEVQGFSVSGRILQSKQGSGIPGAQVYLDNSAVAESGEDGSYQLFNITAGSYTIQVEAPNVEFDSLEVQISPRTPNLPDITPNRFSVCGDVQVPVPPTEAVTAAARDVQVLTGTAVTKTTVRTDGNGRFCAMLPPGQYLFKPLVTKEEEALGLLLQPAELQVSVVDSPILSGLLFTQFLTTLAGSITCLEGCPDVAVTLTRGAPSGSGKTPELRAEVKSSGTKGTFEFVDVLPGRSTVTVDHPSWCWKEESVSVTIAPAENNAVEFIQTGFVLECSCSHAVALSYSRENDSATEVQLQKGHNRLCLNSSGTYSLRPKSCHQFEAEYIFRTSSPALVVMAATTHRVSATLLSPKKTEDVAIKIRSLRFGLPDQHLVPEEVTELQGDTVLHAYHFSLLASSGDDLEVTPVSSELMFIPESRKHTVSEDCPERIPPFNGSPGLMIIGRIDPPLEGVSIVIALQDGTVIDTATNRNGEYRVGPIHGEAEYTVGAALDGYVLEPLPNDAHSFTALKLSQIIVKVTDSNGGVLPGALVSLSGANFRSNNFTGDSGELSFTQLSPGQYFVKPLLREFEFAPSSKVIELEQGHSEDVTFIGQRVAFSCSGKVMSLNRQPQEGISVQVASVDEEKCGSFADESVSDASGVYKLRGLKPECEYIASVRSGDGAVEHSLPSKKIVQVANSDVEDVDFLVVFSAKTIQVTGNVIADSEHLSTLKLNVYSEGKSLCSVGVDSIGFFILPPLPISTEESYQVVLDTNLSPHFYNFSRSEQTFTATGDTHITMEFHAEKRDLDRKSHEGSFVGIILGVILIFVLFNIDTIVERIQSGIAARQRPQEAAAAGLGDIKKRTGHGRR